MTRTLVASKIKKIKQEPQQQTMPKDIERTAYLMEKFGFNVNNIPLSDYRKKPFYQSKNDALDRFGTRLEKRFNKAQITKMLTNAGCTNIEFSPNTPFWCCVGFKK